MSLDTRAHIIFDFLRERIDQPLRKADVLDALNLRPSSTTDKAIQRAARIAYDNDLCLPIPCHENGFILSITANPRAVIDSKFQLAAIATGIGLRKELHDRFVLERVAELLPEDRARIHAMDRFDRVEQDIQEARRAVLDLVRAERKAAVSTEAAS